MPVGPTDNPVVEKAEVASYTFLQIFRQLTALFHQHSVLPNPVNILSGLFPGSDSAEAAFLMKRQAGRVIRHNAGLQAPHPMFLGIFHHFFQQQRPDPLVLGEGFRFPAAYERCFCGNGLKI